MKKKVFALVLSLCMLFPLASVFASAVPYTPTGMAWKDFGQTNYYIHEVTKGEKAPKMDGVVTDTDGYGEPIGSYSMHYCTTAEKAITMEDSIEFRPEYKLRDDGTYYVYPTASSPDAVWNSISSIEVSDPALYVYSQRNPVSATAAFSASTTYYFFNYDTQTFTTAYKVTAETLRNYDALNSSGTTVQEHELLTVKPDDWETNYTKYYTRGFTSHTSESLTYTAVKAENGAAPQWKKNTYYRYKYVRLTQQPADWAEKYNTYYTKNDPTNLNTYGYTAVKAVDGAAPAWDPNIYWKKSPVHVTQLYTSSEGATTQVSTVTRLKQDHVQLPEEVKVYARYDNTYLYYAIEMTEPAHRNIFYKLQTRYSVNMANNMNHFANSDSATIIYHKELDGTLRSIKNTLCRTYINASTALSTAGYQAGIINKYGKEGCEDITEVLTPYNYFNITHQSYEKLHPKTETPAEEETEISLEETSDTTSGTYGKTTYEFKQRWDVINCQYSPKTSKTAVPELFGMMPWIQLDNKIGQGMHLLCLNMPRDTRQLPGSISASSSGNYPKNLYTMRYPSYTGLTEGAAFGTYRWQWANISSGYNPFTREYVITDYFALSNKKTMSSSHIPSVYYTVGQELAEEYVEPQVVQTQIRTDDSEQQGMRFLVQVNATNREIEEVGCLVAPTEVARRQQLKYGMTEIRYICEDNPTYYGIVEDPDTGAKTWMNLTEDADTYFASSSTPNDSDSFAASDTIGGKKSGIYTVHNLKADLANPYEEQKSGKYKIYSMSLTGLYDDFDDYFTFYTIRPYVKYADGTIAYGPNEYKSIYYIACWAIQQMVSAKNAGTSDATSRYTMEQMPLTAAKDDKDNTIKDAAGNTVYVDSTNTSSSMSTYYGAGEFSIYNDENRLEVFRAYAVSYLNRVNKTSNKVKNYDQFDEKFKGYVDEMVERYEFLWKCIVECEAKRYIMMK